MKKRWPVWKWKVKRRVVSAVLALPLPDRWDRPLREQEKFLENTLKGRKLTDELDKLSEGWDLHEW